MKSSIENGVLWVEAENEIEANSLGIWMNELRNDFGKSLEGGKLCLVNKVFKPKEGDWILVGATEGEVCKERIYLFIDKHGGFVCVSEGHESNYLNRKGVLTYSWPYARPMQPNKILCTYLGDIIRAGG
jgi:hypothetical protein